MSFQIHRALASDNADLCAIFRATPMQGSISVAFEREPDYFAGAKVQNIHLDIFLGRDSKTGRVPGLFSVGHRPVYLNGQRKDVRYFCDLRIRPEYRNGTLLARGYRYINKHIMQGAEFAQTVIVADNIPALDMLLSGRASLPRYLPYGNYNTFAVSLRQKFKQYDQSLKIRRAGKKDIVRMQSFMLRQAIHKQFFPVYDLNQIGQHAYYQAQNIEDYWLAFHGSELVGMLGVWDQKTYKQSRIVHYSRSMQWLRPVLNRMQFLSQGFYLPSVGSLLNYFTVHTILTQDNDAEVLRSLLHAIGVQYADQYDYFLLGLDAKDALTQALRSLQKRVFRGRHFLVTYGDQDPREQLNPGPFYIEAARL